MGNRLSYSQARLYSECGQKYKYYYKDKLREKTKSGALLFGSAFDKATESLLKHNIKHGNWDFDEVSVFDAAWGNAEINKVVHDATDCPLIGYAAADFDYELLKEEDIKFLKAKIFELGFGEPDLEAFYKELAELKKQNDSHIRTWTEAENRLHNLSNWLSMRRKGHLMLLANRKYILPKIEKVIGAQIVGELTNDEGDTVISYLDLECMWDGQHVIFDYKTSAREYDKDAVLVSQQLSIYGFTHNVPYGGYFVFSKHIRKNRVKICSKCGFDGSGGRAKTCDQECPGVVVKRGKEVEGMVRCGGEWNETIHPEALVDVLINELPKRTQEIVIENLNTINNGIKHEIYSRNFNSCKTGYGRCPYFDLCYKNDDSNLEKT